ncbi:hypothetical protein, partial [Limosilactobacillus fermentum]
ALPTPRLIDQLPPSFEHLLKLKARPFRRFRRKGRADDPVVPPFFTPPSQGAPQWVNDLPAGNGAAPPKAYSLTLGLVVTIFKRGPFPFQPPGNLWRSGVPLYSSSHLLLIILSFVG